MFSLVISECTFVSTSATIWCLPDNNNEISQNRKSSCDCTKHFSLAWYIGDMTYKAIYYLYTPEPFAMGIAIMRKCSQSCVWMVHNLMCILSKIIRHMKYPQSGIFIDTYHNADFVVMFTMLANVNIVCVKALHYWPFFKYIKLWTGVPLTCL